MTSGTCLILVFFVFQLFVTLLFVTSSIATLHYEDNYYHSGFLAGHAIAFPHMDMLTGPLATNTHKLKRQIDASAPQGEGAQPLVPPIFDAKSQYVSTTGKHKVNSFVHAVPSW